MRCSSMQFHNTSDCFPKKMFFFFRAPLSSLVCLFTAYCGSGHLLAEVIGKNRITVCVTVRKTQGLVCQLSACSGRRSGSHVQKHVQRLTAAEVESCRQQLPPTPLGNNKFEIFNIELCSNSFFPFCLCGLGLCMHACTHAHTRQPNSCRNDDQQVLFFHFCLVLLFLKSVRLPLDQCRK